MKLRTILSLSLASAAFSCFSPQSYAQDAAAPTVPPPAEAGEAPAKANSDGKAALREQLKAARRAANEDPAVREARKALREAGRNLRSAERAAIIAKDPSAAEAFGKPRERKEGEEKPEGPRPDRAAQFEKYRALREQVANEPAVKEAAGKRDQAREAYVIVLKAALIKADPSLSPEVIGKLAERMSADRPGKHRGRRGGPGGKGHHGPPRGEHGHGPHNPPPAPGGDHADAPPAPPEGAPDSPDDED